VTQVVAYSSVDLEQPDEETLNEIRAGRFDWITVTSSAIARSLVRLFGESLNRSKLVTISPITTSVLGELGFAITAEAKHYTAEGIVEAILQHEAKSNAAT
jgi:uroporphyrinogen III methyltransferase/synthase